MQFIHKANRIGVMVTGSTLVGATANCPVRTTQPGVNGIDGFMDFNNLAFDSSGGLVPMLIFNRDVPTEWEVGLYKGNNNFETEVVRGSGSGSVVLYGSANANFVNFSSGDKLVYLVDSAYIKGTNHTSPLLRWEAVGIDVAFNTITKGYAEYICNGYVPVGADSFPRFQDFDGVIRGSVVGYGFNEDFTRRFSTLDNTTPEPIFRYDVGGNDSVYIKMQLVGSNSVNATSVFEATFLIAEQTIIGSPALTLVEETPGNTELSTSTITAAMNANVLEVDLTSSRNNYAYWIVTGSATAAT